MLYAALFWRPRPGWWPKIVVLRRPDVSIYHRGWGRDGDVGYVAVEGRRRVGAVWYRLFTEASHGDGYIDDETPELAIAVVPDARGRGVGRALMTTIHERARRDGLQRVALSVNEDNPAKRLYASLGYVDYEPGDGKERMVLDLG
jgi:GNAT superfamily N-acetyltransferase